MTFHKSNHTFEVLSAEPLPEWIQVNALFKDFNGILKQRCYFIGKVREFYGEKDIFDNFIAPIELFDGQFLYSGENSNFLRFEVRYSNQIQKEVNENV